jgi:hypothetical protein
MADLGEFLFEIQVRTISQHIWAAASHKLQYKVEESVPPPLRRSIHRVSALLETVDLEFDRILKERQSYRENDIPSTSDSEPLNVDLLGSLLNTFFPVVNRIEGEPYSELLSNLNSLSVTTVADLKTLLQKHLDTALEADKIEVQDRRKTSKYHGTSKERTNMGVYFTHVGLARNVLKAEFGDKTNDIFLASAKMRTG